MAGRGPEEIQWCWATWVTGDRHLWGRGWGGPSREAGDYAKEWELDAKIEDACSQDCSGFGWTEAGWAGYEDRPLFPCDPRDVVKLPIRDQAPYLKRLDRQRLGHIRWKDSDWRGLADLEDADDDGWVPTR